MRDPKEGQVLNSQADREKLPLKIIELDVTKDTSVKNAIHSITNEEEIKTQFETNLFGLIRTTQEVLPVMRRQNSGFIVNISSGAGRFGYSGGATAYVSTKFVVEGLTESMSYELQPFVFQSTISYNPGYFLSRIRIVRRLRKHVSSIPFVK